MKKNIKYLIIIIWIIIIYILKMNNVISFDLEVVKQYLKMNEQFAMVIFTLIWILRILIFIPGIPFIILGGICFGPIEGFLLSMIGMAISETIIFIISKTFIGSKLKNFLNSKYPDLNNLVEKYNYKILVVGIICPISPTDVICFLSAAAGINFRKYIMVVILSNIPGTLLYSILGLSFAGSSLSIGLIIVSMVIVMIFTATIWNNLKKNLVLSK